MWTAVGLVPEDVLSKPASFILHLCVWEEVPQLL